MKLLKESALAVLEAITLIIVTAFVLIGYVSMAIYTGFMLGLYTCDHVIADNLKKK